MNGGRERISPVEAAMRLRPYRIRAVKCPAVADRFHLFAARVSPAHRKLRADPPCRFRQLRPGQFQTRKAQPVGGPCDAERATQMARRIDDRRRDAAHAEYGKTSGHAAFYVAVVPTLT